MALCFVFGGLGFVLCVVCFVFWVLQSGFWWFGFGGFGRGVWSVLFVLNRTCDTGLLPASNVCLLRGPEFKNHHLTQYAAVPRQALI